MSCPKFIGTGIQQKLGIHMCDDHQAEEGT